MKPRENTFRISGLNSLKVHEVHFHDQKQLLNTFKAGNDLRNSLNKNNNSNSIYKKKLQKNSLQLSQTISSLQKPLNQALMDEVTALDNFKTPVTRQKTKNLIENIKLRRRQKHIQTYNNFKQDLDDYKDNLLQIYDSFYNDCFQVLSIKQTQINGYFSSQTEEYLLSRDKAILSQFEQELQLYIRTSSSRLKSTRQELERIKNGRNSVVDQTCEILRLQLVDIAFVLENQAKDIQKKEKQNINSLEKQFYTKYESKIAELQKAQEENNKIMEQKMQQVTKRWRQLQQSHQISSFQSSINSSMYKNSPQKQKLYQQLISLQEFNHQQKKKYLESLIMNEHADSFKKSNIEKWFEVIKAINDDFDKKLDGIVNSLIQELKQSKTKHDMLIASFQKKLQYISNHTQEEIAQMIINKFQPMIDSNNKFSEQMLKSATSYVELNDQKQNTLLENIYKFLMSLAQNNDDFAKQFLSLSQNYELSKAKILDDDEELVEKLNAELIQFKKQLRESLHHIKLEELEKKCFEKIDQIELAYRKTHELNKELIASRPKTLSTFIQNFEQKIALIFQLYDESKRTQLIERNKQDAQKQVLNKIEEEDKIKLWQEQKQAELIKKNGGKAPPPPKPKDPKKLAAQIEERKKALLISIGQKKIEEFKTPSGNTWLLYKSLNEISKEFFKPQTPQTTNFPTQNQNQDSQKDLEIDQLPEPILNTEGQPVTTKESIFKISQIFQYLLTLRDKIFENISVKKLRILTEAAQNDEQIMEQSLTILDERLKKHYSLKGQLQAEIFVKRSGEITNHKKRYEKYARTVRQKMDNQTERFNFLLQKSFQNLKQHNATQKLLREQFASAKILSQFQGLLSKARENHNNFTHQINQVVAELNHLAKTEVQILLQKNNDFIKESKLIKDGGEYSQEEIKWYEQMMNEITTQIKTQQSRRQQKCKQIKDQSEKRKKQLLQKIQKCYHSSIQELSAKDGTGKIYGKPKRIAQEKLRLQMNKCEQSQHSINKQINQLVNDYEKEKSHAFKFQQRPETLKWRKQLMTLWACIDRYAKHLQALKKDLKIKPMIRVNYDQNVPECAMTSAQQDKKLVQEQLKALGPLGEQKQEKSFSKFLLDIEKIISDQSRSIYVGDKAKFLTGNDKIPDFLRKYIASMRQSTEDFRHASIRDLRQSCDRLSNLCDKFGDLFITSIQSFFIAVSQKNFTTFSKLFSEIYKKHDSQKSENFRLLRPNLSNPKCQGQLAKLNEKQNARQSQFILEINNLRQQFKQSHFSNGQKFMTCLINNYQFLLFYCDSLLLFEDFIKVAGDDDQDKKKLNIKKLMVMKQKGISIDSSSQRNLRKKWAGVNFTIINFADKKFTYKKAEIEDPTLKDPKKGAKKDSKKLPNQSVEQQDLTVSKQIETFKTWRQKGVFDIREKCLEDFRKHYTECISQMESSLGQSIKQSEMFNKKWTKIANELLAK